MTIAVQIICGIMLIPMSALILILFNIYARSIGYLFFMTLYFAAYASAAGLLFMELSVGYWVMGSVVVIYIMRISYLSYRLAQKKKGSLYPVILGNIVSKGSSFKLVFLFPIAFIRVLKLTPDFVSRKFREESGVDMNIPQIVDMVLEASMGTYIDITSDDADVYFEIQ